MSVRHVDYDRIAPVYDRRFASDAQGGIAVALDRLARQLGARRVLEVGCGTARWLADMAPTVSELHGLDLSAGMLRQARRRGRRLHLVQGRAASLPYASASFDLVCCVNAIHHFTHQQAFIREACRLLRPGGALAVVGMNPHGRRPSWYVYHYFVGTYETDLARFPSWGTVLDWMLEAGCQSVTYRLVAHIRDDKVGRAVLKDPFLRKKAVSQLTLLSDADYAAGLQRIRAALEQAEARGETLVFCTDLQIGMLVGQVGGRAASEK